MFVCTCFNFKNQISEKHRDKTPLCWFIAPKPIAAGLVQARGRSQNSEQVSHLGT